MDAAAAQAGDNIGLGLVLCLVVCVIGRIARGALCLVFIHWVFSFITVRWPMPSIGDTMPSFSMRSSKAAARL